MILVAACAWIIPAADAARTGTRHLWGAIAYNTKTGAYGYAVDVKSKRDAETSAFRQCASDCEIRSFRDNCGAVAVASATKRASWDTGASREIAESKAMKKCGTGNSCRVMVWACTSER